MLKKTVLQIWNLQQVTLIAYICSYTVSNSHFCIILLSQLSLRNRFKNTT